MTFRRLLAHPATFAAAVLLSAVALFSVPRAMAQPPGGANPLLTPSPLPFEYPPFDKIKDEHSLPAFEQGMADELAEVAAITKRSIATSDNTIVALERSGLLLSRVSTVF